MNLATKTFYLICIGLLSCTSNLKEHEKVFAGSWRHEINTPLNPDSTYGYLQLNNDRSGVVSIVGNLDGKLKHIPGATFQVKNWRVTNDTLIVDYGMKGATIVVPGKKDTSGYDLNLTDHWLIKNIKETEFFAENHSPMLPEVVYTKFKRTTRIDD
jgi:hypothetical protein